MDKKHEFSGKFRIRFNAIDILILLIVLACVVGLAIRFGTVKEYSADENLKLYSVYFTVSNISYTSEDAFVAGDTVTLTEGKTILGTFVGLESILPAEFLARDSEGNLILVSYPETTRIDVSGKIAARGIMTDNGFLANGTTYVAAGKAYAAQTEHMDFVLKITNIVED